MRAFDFDHYPSTGLLQRSAEIPFYADVPHLGHVAGDAFEMYRGACTADEFIEATPDRTYSAVKPSRPSSEVAWTPLGTRPW